MASSKKRPGVVTGGKTPPKTKPVVVLSYTRAAVKHKNLDNLSAHASYRKRSHVKVPTSKPKTSAAKTSSAKAKKTKVSKA